MGFHIDRLLRKELATRIGVIPIMTNIIATTVPNTIKTNDVEM